MYLRERGDPKEDGRREKMEKMEKSNRVRPQATRGGAARRTQFGAGAARRKAIHPRSTIRRGGRPAKRARHAGGRDTPCSTPARARPPPAAGRRRRTSPTPRRSGRPGQDRWSYLAHVLSGVDGALDGPLAAASNGRTRAAPVSSGASGASGASGSPASGSRYRPLPPCPRSGLEHHHGVPCPERAGRRSRCARPTRRAGASLPAPRRRGRGGTRASPAGGRPAG